MLEQRGALRSLQIIFKNTNIQTALMSNDKNNKGIKVSILFAL